MTKIFKIVKIGVFITILTCAFKTGVVVSAADEYVKTDIPQVFINTSQEIEKTDYVTASIAIVDKKDGEYADIIDAQANVKLHGNSTAKAEKKPYKIKLSSKQSVLGMSKEKKWTLLANAYDKTLIRNKLALNFAKQINLAYTSQGEFVDVWVNGEFVGNYLIVEPVEVSSTRVDINLDSGDFMLELERERREADVTYIWTPKYGIRFAIDEPETPTSVQIENIKKVTGNIENSIATHRLKEYSKYIDIESFINYYIASELFKAVDFNYSSTRFYYKSGKMYAGPLWDVDLSSGNANPYFYTGYYINGVSYKGLYASEMKWYNELLKSDEFVAMVKKRYSETASIMENLHTTNSLGKNQIDTYIGQIKDSIKRNYMPKNGNGAGWSMTTRYSTVDQTIGLECYPESTYEANVAALRTWLKERIKWLKTGFESIRNNRIIATESEKKSYNSIYLTWAKAGEADGYEIYCKDNKGTYKLYKTITNKDTYELVIKNLDIAKTYSYKVRSYIYDIKGSKIYTEFGETASTKLTLASPKIKLKALKNNSVKISWKKVKGAKGYVVYMKKSKKGKYKKVATIKNGNKISYTKKNLKAKNKYYFKVKSYVKYGKNIYYSK